MSHKLTRNDQNIGLFASHHFSQFFNSKWGKGLAKLDDAGNDVSAHNGKVEAQASPNMSVRIKDMVAGAHGNVIGNKTLIDEFRYLNITIDAADATDSRFDLVVAAPIKAVDADGTSIEISSNEDTAIRVIKGTASATPVKPTESFFEVVLACVFVPNGAIAILPSFIEDCRDFIGDF